MARARNIKPSFFLNEDLVELPFSTRLLFIGLWTIADRVGRLNDKPKQIKMAIFPADDVDIDAGLAELAQAKFIVRYVIKNERFIEIINFTKHQNPHVKEVASTIPAPYKHRARTRLATPLTDSLLLIPESKTESNKEGERPPDQRQNHPAIIAIQETTGSMPTRDVWDELIAVLGINIDLVKLKACFRKWRARGFKPTNYSWALEWYIDGIPDLRKTNGTNRNANGHKQTPAEIIANRPYR